LHPFCDSCVLKSTRATEDIYSNTDLNNNAYHGSNPTQPTCQVGGSVKCDSGSTVAGATRLVAEASGTALDDGVRFPSEFFITAGTNALG
jgi:hypothetical protein